MPKSTTFEMVVPGSPKEVARRLKQQTRWRPFPYQSSLFGGGRRPLGGRVNRKRFAVSLDERDLLQRTTAVAKATLTPAGAGGTRVKGTAGMLPWVVWYLRFAVLVMVLAIVAVPLIVLGSAGGTAQAVLWALITFLVAGLAGVVAIGMNVAHADERVDGVVAEVERVLLSGGAPPEAEAHAEARPERRKTPDLDRA